MNEIYAAVFGAMVLLGAVTTALYRDPFDKLISLSLLAAGIFPFLVDRGYLDVAAATALIAPLSTIFILMVIRRKPGGA
ncbi:MAG: EhaD family protein [Methanomicrobiales archaeon]|jgi:energy-converting hydrogenase A subunit D|nr:EhaD family protein [Methanomicrobiales archaeon]MDD1644768.1 EhaD family protein [Methanomicrobiales archaeon]MDD1646633.1 EhaD family protein [Methanomicrobiales archaeon]MDD1648610.1 EhaD family protein [Methanomicrobiales archaeon]